MIGPKPSGVEKDRVGAGIKNPLCGVNAPTRLRSSLGSGTLTPLQRLWSVAKPVATSTLWVPFTATVTTAMVTTQTSILRSKQAAYDQAVRGPLLLRYGPSIYVDCALNCGVPKQLVAGAATRHRTPAAQIDIRSTKNRLQAWTNLEAFDPAPW